MGDQRHVIHRSGDFSPIIADGPGGLLYEMPVSSGHATYSFAFPISTADLDVIATDPQRAALLYGALHHPFQLRETHLADDQLRACFHTILHAPLDEVASFLQARNRASNNAIFHLAGMYAELDPRFRWSP